MRASGTQLARARALAPAFARLLVLAPAFAMSGQAATTGDAQLGARLFDGRVALEARIVGHNQTLPAAATRCTNCHATGADAPRIGPRLDRQLLTEPISRRGGPPSVYDARSLCQVLRTGVDPAWVMITRKMPRYRIHDAQCDALWSALSREPRS